MQRLIFVLSLLFLWYHARADTASPVITCSEAVSGQPYSACTAPGETTTAINTTLTLWCSMGAPPSVFSSRETCEVAEWLRFGDLANEYLVLTAAGWQPAGNILASQLPVAPVQPAPAPPDRLATGGGSPSVHLSWGHSWSGERPTYQILDCGSQENCAQAQVLADSVPTTRWESATLSPGLHWFYVRAVTPGGGASERSNGASFTVTVAHAPSPICWPLKRNGRIDAAPRGQYVALWACEKPAGIYHYALYFSWAKAAEWIVRGVLTAAEYEAAYGEISRQMTDEERAYAYGPFDSNGDGIDDSLISRYGSYALVAPNRAALTRPVYALHPDGSRNTTPVAGARVAVSARCRVGLRLTVLGKATRYFSVSGLPNVHTTDPNDVLGDVYTLCNVAHPMGVN